ncbi:MAG TPA: winged helix-turn-helix transcriptional regulator, partial [Syntrophorhabdales bacterium]|nr:winged helix-turn-helix transcriptional regulator [Syntrophorhabdales bacterium]
YNEHGRELPWRQTQNPYRILVSEMMLQQTQVDRVLEKYPAFVRQFPNFRALADAYLRDVLAAWQGLGYNRRAVSLKKIGEIVTEKHGGRLRADVDFLRGLPGIGHNTACAILAFAFNRPVVFIETNIRTVFIHFFFADRNDVRDSEILPLVEQTLDRESSHRFYSALMDYGTMLKKIHGSINPKSAHYQKQSPFKGSDRQVRGMLLKHLLGNPNSSQSDMAEKVGIAAQRLQQVLKNLQAEGFVRESNGLYSIAQ